jgi:hypothetical protein
MQIRTRMEVLIEEMLDGQIMLNEALSEFEKLYIQKALCRYNEHLSKTAGALGIHRNTLKLQNVFFHDGPNSFYPENLIMTLSSFLQFNLKNLLDRGLLHLIN